MNGEHDVTIALEDAKFEGTYTMSISHFTLTILRKVTNQNCQVELPTKLTGCCGTNEVFTW